MTNAEAVVTFDVNEVITPKLSGVYTIESVIADGKIEGKYTIQIKSTITAQYNHVIASTMKGKYTISHAMPTYTTVIGTNTKQYVRSKINGKYCII